MDSNYIVIFNFLNPLRFRELATGCSANLVMSSAHVHLRVPFTLLDPNAKSYLIGKPIPTAYCSQLIELLSFPYR